MAAFACTLGIVPHLIAAMMGLAALLHASAVAYEIVKYAGVAYLLWMAWQTLKEQGALKVGDINRETGAVSIVRAWKWANACRQRIFATRY